ncbi:MAG: IclR family transcriptional regulator [Oscillospiraceae bacterium]|nr:IclR family transcriptional regulator [Oscillospiraceae bacterium]
MMSDKWDEREPKVKSLAKSLSILECFTSRDPELGITQLSEKLGLNKSNVHNIVSTFEKCGYLERNPISEKYHLGFRVLEYAYVLNEHLGYQRAVYSTLRELAEKSGGMVYFAIPKNRKVLYICNAYPSHMNTDYPYRSILGETAPMTCTSLGKSMLAFMKPLEVDEVLRLPRERFTDSTLLEEDVIRAELIQVVKQGYSMDRMEHEYGVNCIAAPLFNRTGLLTGAISISGHTQIFTTDSIERFQSWLKEATFTLRDRI